MDIDTLRHALSEPSLAAIGVGFLAGFVFSFNTVAIASIPVTLAYVTKAREPRRAVWLGAAFILGLLVTHVVLGVAAALGGNWVTNVMGRGWDLVLGPILIFLGLLWPGWIKVRLPWFALRGQVVSGAWGAFLLAIPFSIAICPFCTPALLVMLTAAAGIASVPFAFALLLAFALGRAVPIALGAAGIGWLESLKMLTRFQKPFEIAGALLLIASGIYLISDYYAPMTGPQ
ncbi:MAG TPA: cytochrome c biogenesis protein CcdA [Burkholderiales bacterium]|nr:cytochrome c biogenesis protein CcdA [Burkholderiales bacterium]